MKKIKEKKEKMFDFNAYALSVKQESIVINPIRASSNAMHLENATKNPINGSINKSRTRGFR